MILRQPFSVCFAHFDKIYHLKLGLSVVRNALFRAGLLLLNVVMTDALAVNEAASFIYMSLQKDALAVPEGLGYADPTTYTSNITVLSWVNDTENPTTSESD